MIKIHHEYVLLGVEAYDTKQNMISQSQKYRRRRFTPDEDKLAVTPWNRTADINGVRVFRYEAKLRRVGMNYLSWAWALIDKYCTGVSKIGLIYLI